MGRKLAARVSDEQLAALFHPYGAVVSAKVFADWDQRTLCYGYC